MFCRSRPSSLVLILCQVIPLLKILYYAQDRNFHHIYMALIVLLILSEDDAFNKSVHELVSGGVGWGGVGGGGGHGAVGASLDRIKPECQVEISFRQRYS